MSVTVIPYNDPTSDIFNAWRTIEDIKNKAKQVAMDQALAQQHIQSSQTIDQMNQAKLQMDQQQAKEYTSPESVANRRETMNTALQQKQGDVTQTSLQNERMLNENPLHLIQQQQLARQARIHADEAQQGYNQMMELMPKDTELKKMTMQAEKYKLISQNLTDPHTADLMSQINSIQTKQTLDQLPKVMEFQQKQLDQALTDMGTKGIVDRLKTFSAAAGSLGVPGAKAAVAGMPGYENFGNVPDDSIGQRGQKDFTHNLVVGLAKEGDQSARELLGEQIAVGMGAKPRPPQMVDEKTGKPFMTMEPDVIREAAKKVADRYIQKAKLNPQTGEYSIGDETGANAIQRRETVLQGTQKIPAGGPTIPPPTPPVSGQAQPEMTTQSGTIDLNKPSTASATDLSNAAYDTAIDRFKRYRNLLDYAAEDNSTPTLVGTAKLMGHAVGIGKGPEMWGEIFTNRKKFESIPEKKRDEIFKSIQDSNATPKQQDIAQNLVGEMMNSDHPLRVFQAFGSTFGASTLTKTQQQLINKLISDYKLIKE